MTRPIRACSSIHAAARPASSVVDRDAEIHRTEASERASPILGVRPVRQTAEYDRDTRECELDPEDSVFAPPGTPDRVNAIVKRANVSIHFQIRRSDAVAARSAIEHDADL